MQGRRGSERVGDMEFNPFLGPLSSSNVRPRTVEDLVSPLEKPSQSQKKVDFTLQLNSTSSCHEENAIPRVPGHCDMCLVDETPLWRGGPNGPKTLCNACGLRYSKELKKVKLVLGEKGKPSTADARPRIPRPEGQSATKKRDH